MGLDLLVVDLLRPSGTLHTIVVKLTTAGDAWIVADLADAAPPDALGPTPVDVGSLRLLNAGGMDVSVFRSRPTTFARQPSSSVYDVRIEHAAIPAQRGVYYLGVPPEWSVCSVRVDPPAWTGLHSHVDDSSWIECAFASSSSARKPLAICVSLDSDPAHGLSRLPEFGVLRHRHSPVEIIREAGPGALGVRIDLKAVLRAWRAETDGRNRREA
jgi:hypothetical protein